MNSKEKADLFSKVYDKLTWEYYSELVEGLNRINLSKLDLELCEMSSLYAYFNGLLARCKKDCDFLELEYESIGAKARNSAVLGSQKKLSVKRLEDVVFSDELYINKYKEFIEAETKYNLLKGLLDSLRIRHECLVQLSANQRAETKLV